MSGGEGRGEERSHQWPCATVGNGSGNPATRVNLEG